MLPKFIIRNQKSIKSVSAKKSEFSFFLSQGSFLGTHFGQSKNCPLLSELKPPLEVTSLIIMNTTPLTS